MNIKVFLSCIILALAFSSCEKENKLGDAELRFHGFDSGFEIEIFPISLWGENLLYAEPMLTLELDESGKAYVKDLLTGDYFWWDSRNRKGVFQIVAGGSLSFDFYDY